jgi:DtxR family transcriptional regulator, Mn-dependent transcriptional regulator
MTNSEENYIKVIYHLSTTFSKGVSTNAIAEMMETKASSVTDMLKKLSDKELVLYEKYQGVTLTENGIYLAKMIVRKHRLWEVFLVDTLGFAWDEVHEIAEELEHIKSDVLIKKLDSFLNFPEFDPHGDPIPNELGQISNSVKIVLSDAVLNQKYVCVGVKDSSSDFLQYLNRQKIALGTHLCVLEKESFDNSLLVSFNDTTISISHKIANNLYIQ